MQWTSQRHRLEKQGHSANFNSSSESFRMKFLAHAQTFDRGGERLGSRPLTQTHDKKLTPGRKLWSLESSKTMAMFVRVCQQFLNIDGNPQLRRVCRRLTGFFRPFSRHIYNSSGGMSRLVKFSWNRFYMCTCTAINFNAVFPYFLHAILLSCKSCRVKKLWSGISNF